MRKGQIQFLQAISCLQLVLSYFQEKSLGFDRKKDLRSYFKEKQRTSESQVRMEDTWKMAWPCSKVAWPCSSGRSHAKAVCHHARSCMVLVPWCTVSRASRHDCASLGPMRQSGFSNFLKQILFEFQGEAFLRGFLEGQLGLILSIHKPLQGVQIRLVLCIICGRRINFKI